MTVKKMRLSGMWSSCEGHRDAQFICDDSRVRVHRQILVTLCPRLSATITASTDTTLMIPDTAREDVQIRDSLLYYQVSQIPPLPWSKIFCQNCTWGVICDKCDCKIYAWGVIKWNFVGIKLLLRELGELFQINRDTKSIKIW